MEKMIDEYYNDNGNTEIDLDSIVDEAEWKSDVNFSWGLLLTVFAWCFGFSIPPFYFNWLPLNEFGWQVFIGWSIAWTTISIVIGAIYNRRIPK